MRTKPNYGGLDRFRIAAALFVIAIHTSPLASFHEGADFFLTRVLARIAVPFFFMVTGQFVAAGLLSPSVKSTARFHKYLLKTSLLYLFCIVLYLPLGIYAGHYKELTLGGGLRMFFFDGTFYHLWYFPACILGMLLVYLMSRFLSLQAMTIVSAVLYVIGLFGDSYYGLAQKVPALEAIYGFLFQISSYTRNGLFLAPLFLVLGAWMAQADRGPKRTESQKLIFLGLLTALCFALMTGEAFLLRHFELQRHDSMYLMLIPVMFFLYRFLLCLPVKSSGYLRAMSTWIYVLHPAFIVVVRGIAKPLHLTGLLVDNSLVHYLAVCLLSVAAGLVMAFLQSRFKLHPLAVRGGKGRAADEVQATSKAMPMRHRAEPEAQPSSLDEWEPEEEAIPDSAPLLQDDIYDPAQQEEADAPVSSRAWIEVDAAALEQNVDFLRSRLPAHCRLMPAVKAEGYGHGAVLISRELNRLGVDAFCVASLSEGIELRRAGIQGECLILGYTPPEDFPLLARYQLTQTVIDYPYAELLNQSESEIHVHIGIDTGMHRLGIRCERIEEIKAVYEMGNLKIDGLFSHLCASDSFSPEAIAFTEGQVRAFFQVIDILKEDGYPCPGIHLLASYGILRLLKGANVQEGAPQRFADRRSQSNGLRLAGDYVRPGIALYGVLSSTTDTEPWKGSLKPVLSLKAMITSVRPLYAGEAAGYGIAFTAQEDMRIAAISIGYGDGLPRELSNGKGSVLIRGHKAPIIGRICMDQAIVDISGIPQAQEGDIAVIIGKSGEEEITVGQIAEQCGTITNEILCRLGSRLDRVLV